MHLNTHLRYMGSLKATGNYRRNLGNIIAESYKEDKLFKLNYKNNIFSNLSNDKVS